MRHLECSCGGTRRLRTTDELADQTLVAMRHKLKTLRLPSLISPPQSCALRSPRQRFGPPGPDLSKHPLTNLTLKGSARNSNKRYGDRAKEYWSYCFAVNDWRRLAEGSSSPSRQLTGTSPRSAITTWRQQIQKSCLPQLIMAKRDHLFDRLTKLLLDQY